MTEAQEQDRDLQQGRGSGFWFHRDQQTNPNCIICSTEDDQVNHYHFSSKWMREFLGVEAANQHHLCPSCKSRHGPYPYSRAKLVVSDDTLHMFFAPPPPGHTEGTQYEGDLMHVDYLSIPGANLNTLTNAFKYEYQEKPFLKPLDVVLIGGYNDILEGCARTEIMERFRKYSDAVLAAAPKNAVNTVAISDLMYPPALSWFPDDGRLPPEHEGNRLHILEWLNEAILSLNLDHWITEFHRLHNYGIRVYTRRGRDKYGQQHTQKIRQHRFDHWQGEQRHRKLHLINAQRFRLGAAINKYFQLRTTTEW